MTESDLTTTIQFLSSRLHEVEQERDAMQRRAEAAEQDWQAIEESLGPPVPACPQCMVLDVGGVWLKEHTDGTWTCGHCEEPIEEQPTFYRQVFAPIGPSGKVYLVPYADVLPNPE